MLSFPLVHAAMLSPRDTTELHPAVAPLGLRGKVVAHHLTDRQSGYVAGMRREEASGGIGRMLWGWQPQEQGAL
jgi:hypothetical protein